MNSNVPEIILNKICTISVSYVDFEGVMKTGNIVCNKLIKQDILQIFDKLFDIGFPINLISPISEFNNDDLESVKANNSSCFNWRFVIGSNKLSDHALGLAIDINPMQNPWIHPSAHKIDGRSYNPEQKGTITKEVVDIFKSHGFKWGGDWKNPDYQHFFKEDNLLKELILQSIKESKIMSYLDFKRKI